MAHLGYTEKYIFIRMRVYKKEIAHAGDTSNNHYIILYILHKSNTHTCHLLYYFRFAFKKIYSSFPVDAQHSIPRAK